MKRSSRLVSSAVLSTKKNLVARKKKINQRSVAGAKRHDEWKAISEFVMVRDGYRCQMGNERAEHVHHIQMRSQGGTDETSNLTSLCFRCHRFIHDNPLWAKAMGWLK